MNNLEEIYKNIPDNYLLLIWYRTNCNNESYDAAMRNLVNDPEPDVNVNLYWDLWNFADEELDSRGYLRLGGNYKLESTRIKVDNDEVCLRDELKYIYHDSLLALHYRLELPHATYVELDPYTKPPHLHILSLQHKLSNALLGIINDRT